MSDQHQFFPNNNQYINNIERKGDKNSLSDHLKENALIFYQILPQLIF